MSCGRDLDSAIEYAIIANQYASFLSLSLHTLELWRKNDTILDMDCQAVQQTINILVRSLITSSVLIGMFLLFTTLLLISLRLRKYYDRLFDKFTIWIVFVTLFSLLLFASQFIRFPIFFLSALLPFVYSLIGGVFPLFFIFYLAWKNEIPLALRYMIIVSYIIMTSILFVSGFIWTVEQIIFGRKVCFGISCSICNNLDLKNSSPHQSTK